MENNEMIISSRINYSDYQQLNRIRLNRLDKGKHPSISEIVREAITQYIGENK